jgi:hypothetical protein
MIHGVSELHISIFDMIVRHIVFDPSSVFALSLQNHHLLAEWNDSWLMACTYAIPDMSPPSLSKLNFAVERNVPDIRYPVTFFRTQFMAHRTIDYMAADGNINVVKRMIEDGQQVSVLGVYAAMKDRRDKFIEWLILLKPAIIDVTNTDAFFDWLMEAFVNGECHTRCDEILPCYYPAYAL